MQLNAWVDVPGAEFCPRWGDMKKKIDCEMAKGVNKGVHTVKPTWRAGGLAHCKQRVSRW